MATYPTSLDTFTNPTATDPRTSPSHAVQHSDANDAIEALEAKLGIGASAASAATTGHVMTKLAGGGTGWSAPTGSGGVNGWYDVTSYGATGNGTTDDGASIQSAINAANTAGGGTVYFPPGTYKIASANGTAGQILTLPSKVSLVGAGKQATILRQAVWTDHLIYCQGTGATTQKTTLSANAVVHTNSLSLTSLTGVSTNDYYIVRATLAQSTENTTRYQGEIVQVRATPSSNPYDIGTPAAGTVNLKGFIRDNYPTANSAAIDGPLVFNVGNQIRDLTIDNSSPATTHTVGFIRLVVCKDFLIDNVELVGCDEAGIVVQNCVDGTISNCILRDFSDVNNTSTDPAGFYGYGISVELASENIAIVNCVGDRLRHFITTDGIDSRYGVPRGLIISGCVGKNCTDFVYDTHAPTADTVFSGCHAYNSPAGGFEIRGVNNQLLVCSTSYVPKGIQIKPDAHGSSIIGCVIRHSDWAPSWTNSGSGAGSGVGIQLVASGANAAKNVTIKGCRIDACGDNGIQVDGNSDNLKIMHNEIYNVGRHRSSATQQNAIKFASALTLEGVVIAYNEFGNHVGAASTEPGASGTSDSTPNTTLSTDYGIYFGATTGTHTNCKYVNNLNHRLAVAHNTTLPAGWTNSGNI